jgi:hypothetical protein
LSRSTWNRVHSRQPRDWVVGIELAEAMMIASDLDAQVHNDLVYLIALANYKLGSKLAARRHLIALLEVTHPA